MVAVVVAAEVADVQARVEWAWDRSSHQLAPGRFWTEHHQEPERQHDALGRLQWEEHQ